MKGCKGYFLPSDAKSMAVINRVWNASRGMYIYLYDSDNDVDDTVTLVAARVTQKNRNFMLAQSSAHSVDRLCSVPWIDFSKSSGELAAFLRDRTDLSSYQRPVNSTRVNSIDTFWRPNNKNYIVNSVTIWLPQIEHNEGEDEVHHWGIPFIRYQIPVSAPGAPGVTIEVADICPVCGLVEPNGLFFDACPRNTRSRNLNQRTCTWMGRPGEIVDGQHRIRGTGYAGPRKTQPLPISLMLGDQFNNQRKAKIFKEITTNSAELHVLHRLNLVYKFSGMQTSSLGAIPGTAADPVDFRGSTPKGVRFRKAYETATFMCENGGIGSRWINRIGLAPTTSGKKQKGVLILADKLVNMIAPWYVVGGAFDGLTALDAAEQLAEYLDAILDIWPSPGGTPAGGSTLWENRTGRAKKVLQQSPVISALLLLHPTIHSRAKLAAGGGPARSDYENQLRYLEEINWSENAWYNPYSGGQNQADLLFRIIKGIMEDCTVTNPNAPDGGMGGGPIPVADRRILGGALVNTWSETANPDPFSWGGNTIPIGGFRAVSAANPLILTWRSDLTTGHPHLRTRPNVPLNADDKAVLTASYNGNESSWNITGGINSFSIEDNTFTPVAGSPNIIFTLKYSSSQNRNRTISLTVPI